MTPKVSVCMIAYKHEAFVAQAIQSVLDQTVSFELELVIGEDRGPDGTRSICEQYAARDSRVRLLPSDRNHGVMANFRRTLAACDGEFVAVCEGDDYWTDPFKLSKQVAILDERPDFAGSAHQSLVLNTSTAPNRLFRAGVPRHIGINDLLAGRLFHTASIMFRRSVLETILPAPDVLSADRLVNLCTALQGTIHYSDEVMCVYRRHGGGMSYNVTPEQLKMDLSCVPYLSRLNHQFPKYRYQAYIFATIGLCTRSSPRQMLIYSALAALYSFSYFPNNLFQAIRWLRSRLSNASQQS